MYQPKTTYLRVSSFDWNAHTFSAPNCTDDKKNQDETDINCGGLTCEACKDNQYCLVDADCLSNSCKEKVCVAAVSKPVSKSVTNNISAIVIFVVSILQL